MSERNGTSDTSVDPTELSSTMSDIAERSQRIVTEFLARQSAEPSMNGNADPLHVGDAFFEMTSRLIADPTKLVEAQMSLWNDYMHLWQNTALRLLGEEATPVVEPEKSDKRFKDEMWQENEVFDFIKQSYLLTARWIHGVVHDVHGLDQQTAKKVDFYTRQFTDAMSPSNFLATNPEVLRATVESGGENLIKGLDNLLADLERGKGKLSISMTDMDAFQVGENIACSPGKVVFQNPLIQLIQYSPTTEQVNAVPLVIIPPWINKYYILDLRPKNSLVRWAVEQGHTVFMISWVNPDESLADRNFEDYMADGLLAALEQIEKITGEHQVNAIGYCLGGTLLATTLAYMAATNDDRIRTAAFMASMTDFSDVGEISVFIDEEQLQYLEEKMQQQGFLDGSEMATTFNMLRANDLIWSFVVNNYLLGKEPFPFDLLYWNSDSTRMPAAMHSFYLRNMYQKNLLKEPNALNMRNVPIDLGKIKIPTYFVSTRDDHIAPWKTTYAGPLMVSGPSRFVLSASGHIAGIVNPPEANKYCYWTNTRLAKDPDVWFKGAKQQDGSWWTDWAKWVAKQTGAKVAARIPGAGPLPALEDAPGSYVRVQV